MGRQDEVRLIAYRIWEAEGCPQGRETEHWQKAETMWEEMQKVGKSLPGKVETEIVAVPQSGVEAGKGAAPGPKTGPFKRHKPSK